MSASPAAPDGTGLTILMTGELNEAQQAQIRAAVPSADVRYFTRRADLEALAGLAGEPLRNVVDKATGY